MAASPRQILRKTLLAQREAFMASSDSAAAAVSLARHIGGVLVELEPASLGVCWPHRFEFNAVAAVVDDPRFAALPLALPFAQRDPPRMHFRAWNRSPPTARDECGIPCSDGAEVVPDVVFVPCVGFTPIGFRLGYGGGFFDRWLALNPHVTAVGIAWSGGELEADAFLPEPHDVSLALVVTENGAM